MTSIAERVDDDEAQTDERHIHLGRAAAFVDSIHRRIHTADSRSLQREATSCAEIAATFVFPGRTHNNAPGEKNELTDLLAVMPYAKKYNLANPGEEPILRRNLELSIDSYKSHTHPSENGAWELILERLEKSKLVTEFWEDQTTGFARDPESLKPLSLQDGPVVETEALANFLEENDIDKITILALAVQTLHKLCDARERLDGGEPIGDTASILSLADKAEGLLEPLCDVISFDQLHSALHDNAVIVRHYLAGNREQVRKLKIAYDKYGDAPALKANMDSILMNCIGQDFSRDIEIVHAGPSNYVFLGGSVDTASAAGKDYSPGHENHAQTTFKYRGRAKSFGSFLEKYLPSCMALGESPEPMDIFGYTLIPADDADVGGAYKQILEHLNNLKEQGLIEFQAAASRKEALHIKGSQEFMDSVVEDSYRTDEERDPLEGHLIDPKLDYDGYNVAKVTFFFTSPDNPSLRLPVEIQVLSQTVRDGLRTDTSSHFFFKLRKLKKRLFTEEEKVSNKRNLKRISNQLLRKD